ncbi:hypothetical protein CEPID_07720 [Corynebacterium epidermidicanis]|uniref:Uncharacterized protein n=2 Tax=Corynebacterium epidermidicanis TaxID=1050174 RepID=A0A0G3GQH4_9CORY|nr:hypothetical protein CEPID_07720 [Corynebacterium epidermidicanis]
MIAAASGITLLALMGNRTGQGNWRIRSAPILSAVGGTMCLITGLAHATAYAVALDRGFKIVLTGSRYAVGLALISCLIGGIMQLPARWTAATSTLILGPSAVGWLSVQTNDLPTRIAAGLVALCTAIVAAVVCRRTATQPLSISVVCALIALTSIGSIMVYGTFVAFTPTDWWRDFASPHILAYGYAIAAASGILAGFTFAPSAAPATVKDPNEPQ